MAKKTSLPTTAADGLADKVEITGAGITVDMSITQTLRENYMPYAMSVIVARALPEIDGFKPSQRRLLYTMYLMGLLTGPRTKSANVVGQTMKLNPHGDSAIYDTMVRLSRGNETLLHPYVDSKGNFGKSYSRDMASAASRYTEVKLSPIASCLFGDIGKDTVGFSDNYDNTMKEPVLLPVSFPAILVNPNIGIAVAMSSSIPSFNLAEICNTTAALIRDPGHDVKTSLLAPDFPGGGYVIHDTDVFDNIIKTGRGSVRIRSRYEKSSGRIEITEIPPTATIESIMDRISDLIKQGRVREISDMRDETDLRGLRLTIDLKRGVDAEKLMARLFRLTPLEDNFICNITVLLDGFPRQLSVRDLLVEWIAFRRNCVRRRTKYEMRLKEQRLHLLNGLSKILLDIDKAIAVIRGTREEREVVPNLIIAFGIDEEQAEYIAQIRLRHLNRENLLNRVNERERLINEIDGLEKTLADDKLIDRILIEELDEVVKTYAEPRKTQILYNSAVFEESSDEEPPPNYPVTVFFTKEGYFKKITPQSLRMSGEQRFKEGDSLLSSVECGNTSQLLFFTNRRQVYKCRTSTFEDSKASVIGDYVANTLAMPEGEYAVAMAVTDDYRGYVLFFYSDGKASKVPLSAYETKLNRKKLSNAYSPKSDIVNVFSSVEDEEYAIFSSNDRMLIIGSGLIPIKQTKETQGTGIMMLRKNALVKSVAKASHIRISSAQRFRSKNLPAAGGIVREGDIAFPGDL